MNEIIEQIDGIIKKCYSGKYENLEKEISCLMDILINSNLGNEENLLVFKQLLTAYEDKDYVAFADYLEYGLKRIITGKDGAFGIDIPYSEIIPFVDEKIFYMTSFLDDEPVLCFQKDDKVVRLNSMFSPKNEVEYWIKELNIKENTPVICIFGLGTGLFVEKVLERVSKDTIVFVYEPEIKIIQYCIESGTREDAEIIEKKVSTRINNILQDDRVIICIDERSQLEFQKKLEENVDFTGVVGLVYTYHNIYTEIYKDSYLRFLKTLSTFRSNAFVIKNTYAFFKEDYFQNPFKNLWTVKESILSSELNKVIGNNIPIIIVSAGPSLDKNINVLSKAKGHALIFAVDTAVKYLVEKNIIPDLTITIDPLKPENYFSDERSRTIPCIFRMDANPKIISQMKSKLIILDGQEGYAEILLEDIGRKVGERIRIGGCVANAAFATMLRLRPRKIIFVGQDLAYGVNGTHAGGVDDGGIKETGIYVEDIYGKQIQTRHDWLIYLKWFEDAIKMIKEAGLDIDIIDATEGGAKIHGTEVMTLQEVLDELNDSGEGLPEFDFEAELAKMPPTLSEGEYVLFVNKHREQAEKINAHKVELEEADRICNKLIDGIQENTISESYINKQNKRLTIIRERFEKFSLSKMITDYANTFIIDEITRLGLTDGDRKTNQINLIKAMQISFEAYVKTMDKLLEIIKETII